MPSHVSTAGCHETAVARAGASRAVLACATFCMQVLVATTAERRWSGNIACLGTVRASKLRAATTPSPPSRSSQTCPLWTRLRGGKASAGGDCVGLGISGWHAQRSGPTMTCATLCEEHSRGACGMPCQACATRHALALGRLDSGFPQTASSRTLGLKEGLELRH